MLLVKIKQKAYLFKVVLPHVISPFVGHYVRPGLGSMCAARDLADDSAFRIMFDNHSILCALLLDEDDLKKKVKNSFKIG